MTSPCFRHSYGFDIETVNSPSTSNTSILSESSSSLSTRRRPRTPRKRPNQTYNEAAALLSTAYPNIFSPKTLSHPFKFTRSHQFPDEPSPELLWPLRVFGQDPGFLPHQPQIRKPSCFNEVKVSNFSSDWVGNSSELEEFDAESILDEGTGVGIDSVMGNLSVGDENSGDVMSKDGRFEGFGDGVVGEGVRAFRRGDDWNWWCFPVVDMRQLSPGLSKAPDSGAKPKLKLKPAAKLNSGDKKKAKAAAGSKNSASAAGLMLKLDYDAVLDAWSDRRSPYADDAPVGFLCPNHRECA